MGREYEFSMSGLGDLIKQILDIQKDAVIAITGETGSGKSTLALKIAKECDSMYNMQKQMVFSREELVKQINELPPKSALVCDEAIAVAYRREWMKTAQKELIKVLNICRSRNLILIMCIPDFWALDKDVLYRIRMRIHVIRRGLSILIKPDKNPFADDIWHKKENYDNTKWGWDTNPNFRRIIGWAGLLKFGPMQQYEENEYLPLKKEKTIERFELEKQQDKDRVSVRERRWYVQMAKLENALMERGVSKNQLEKIEGSSEAMIERRRLVAATISKGSPL